MYDTHDYLLNQQNGLLTHDLSLGTSIFGAKEMSGYKGWLSFYVCVDEGGLRREEGRDVDCQAGCATDVSIKFHGPAGERERERDFRPWLLL